MPNSKPTMTTEPAVNKKIQYAYGSRQKRVENFNVLVEFLEKWKNSPAIETENSQLVAERFCNVNFQYGYVSRNDIIQQALMKVNLL